jgi:hypothetical protein
MQKPPLTAAVLRSSFDLLAGEEGDALSAEKESRYEPCGLLLFRLVMLEAAMRHVEELHRTAAASLLPTRQSENELLM